MTTYEVPQGKEYFIPPELSDLPETTLPIDGNGRYVIDDRYCSPLLHDPSVDPESDRLSTLEVLRDVYLTLPPKNLRSINQRLKLDIIWTSNHQFDLLAKKKPNEPHLSALTKDINDIFDSKTGLPRYTTGPLDTEGQPTTTVRDVIAGVTALAHKYPQEIPNLTKYFEVLVPRRMLTESSYSNNQWLLKHGDVISNWWKIPTETYVSGKIETLTETVRAEGPRFALNIARESAQKNITMPPGSTVNSTIESTIYDILNNPDSMSDDYQEALNSWELTKKIQTIARLAIASNMTPDEQQAFIDAAIGALPAKTQREVKKAFRKIETE